MRIRGALRQLSMESKPLRIPVEIRSIRTFHATDGRYHRLAGTDHREFTLDRLIKVPMPCIRYGREDAHPFKELVL